MSAPPPATVPRGAGARPHPGASRPVQRLTVRRDPSWRISYRRVDVPVSTIRVETSAATFTRVAADAGLRVVRLHVARHGCATLLTAAGVVPRVIMEILGHSQISITMDVYTHVVHDTQREAISHMDRLLRRCRPAA
ncbi:tyrosine-type recombinase/integrase [Streptomyces torulosus]|uniref:tyrosine-type recombinase/integrase n=1 Tax=Streptomyces torulosus TaxID=68276 RepID=UPI0023E3C2F7|nr:tyrosine-type recombinase/integrase [Streptomyces torulosus]